MMRAKIKRISLILVVLCILLFGQEPGPDAVPITGNQAGIYPNLQIPKNLVEPVVIEREKNKPSQYNQNNDRSTLAGFAESVLDGNAGRIRGVFSDDVLAFPVIQQPSNNAGYVSTIDEVVTQFSMPASYGVIGLLAHNYLAGESFQHLEIGDPIHIVYGDGEVKKYLVAEIQNYQALQPNSPASHFIDLETNEEMSSSQVYKRVYIGEHHLTLQTCIQKGEIDTWGRMFVIAYPV